MRFVVDAIQRHRPCREVVDNRKCFQIDDDDVVVFLKSHYRLIALVDVDELWLRIFRGVERDSCEADVVGRPRSRWP